MTVGSTLASLSVSGTEVPDGDQPLVRFVNVQKSYDGKVLVVKNLNLDVRRGEFFTMPPPSFLNRPSRGPGERQPPRLQRNPCCSACPDRAKPRHA
jgi:hypothetical protein